MGETNSFLVQNKIITINQIIEISDYLKKALNYYNDMIAQDLKKNNNVNFYKGQYKYYAYIKQSLNYKIEYKDGRKIDTEDEFVFKDALKEPQLIHRIEERLYIAYDDNEYGEVTNHNLVISLAFNEGIIHFITQNKNMNTELYNMSSYISGILNSGGERFNKLIKNRFVVKNSIGLAAGSIVTLIGFLVLLLMKKEDTTTINNFFDMPVFLSMGGWLIAFAIGTIITSPIVNNLYRSVENGLEYAVRGNRFEKHYEDNYRMFNEVMIGKNYNNLEKRKSLEKLFSISKKVLLGRLIISVIIVIVLSII